MSQKGPKDKSFFQKLTDSFISILPLNYTAKEGNKSSIFEHNYSPIRRSRLASEAFSTENENPHCKRPKLNHDPMLLSHSRILKQNLPIVTEKIQTFNHFNDAASDVSDHSNTSMSTSGVSSLNPRSNKRFNLNLSSISTRDMTMKQPRNLNLSLAADRPTYRCNKPFSKVDNKFISYPARRILDQLDRLTTPISAGDKLSSTIVKFTPVTKYNPYARNAPPQKVKAPAPIKAVTVAASSSSNNYVSTCGPLRRNQMLRHKMGYFEDENVDLDAYKVSGECVPSLSESSRVNFSHLPLLKVSKSTDTDDINVNGNESPNLSFEFSQPSTINDVGYINENSVAEKYQFTSFIKEHERKPRNIESRLPEQLWRCETCFSENLLSTKICRGCTISKSVNGDTIALTSNRSTASTNLPFSNSTGSLPAIDGPKISFDAPIKSAINNSQSNSFNVQSPSTGTIKHSTGYEVKAMQFDPLSAIPPMIFSAQTSTPLFNVSASSSEEKPITVFGTSTPLSNAFATNLAQKPAFVLNAPTSTTPDTTVVSAPTSSLSSAYTPTTLFGASTSSSLFGAPTSSSLFGAPTSSSLFGASTTSVSASTSSTSTSLAMSTTNSSLVFNASTPNLLFGASTPALSFGASTPALSFGASTPALSFGASTPALSFGASTPALSFGASIPALSFGASTPALSFGAPTSAPSFGALTSTPSFGGPTPVLSFGASTGPPSFGASTVPPSFGASTVPPSFGASSEHASFGVSTTATLFGAPKTVPSVAAPVFGAPVSSASMLTSFNAPLQFGGPSTPAFQPHSATPQFGAPLSTNFGSSTASATSSSSPFVFGQVASKDTNFTTSMSAPSFGSGNSQIPSFNAMPNTNFTSGPGTQNGSSGFVFGATTGNPFSGSSSVPGSMDRMGANSRKIAVRRKKR